MKVLLVDNFDSFSFNLVHYLEKLDAEVMVETNVSVNLNGLEQFDAIVLSPGPGLPRESGLLMEVIEKALELHKPILGVCLGMQALALHFGDELYNQDQVKHGMQETISVDTNSKLYKNLPQQFKVGLYHSWAVKLKDDSVLKSTAVSENGVVMSLEHTEFPVYGVQYHPESILSEFGLGVISNFLE